MNGWTIKIVVNDHAVPEHDMMGVLEFPHRPTEEELQAKLAAYFSHFNFRFDEKMQVVRECALLCPPRSPIENSTN